MTGHLGLGVVLLAPDKISKVSEIIAVVDEPRNELCFVFKYEDRRVGVIGRDASDERGYEHQLDLPGLDGTRVVLLALPPDLGHQPRQHGQGGPPVQRGGPDVPQAEPLVGSRWAVFLFLLTLHLLVLFLFLPKLK